MNYTCTLFNICSNSDFRERRHGRWMFYSLLSYVMIGNLWSLVYYNSCCVSVKHILYIMTSRVTNIRTRCVIALWYTSLIHAKIEVLHRVVLSFFFMLYSIYLFSVTVQYLTWRCGITSSKLPHCVNHHSTNTQAYTYTHTHTHTHTHTWIQKLWKKVGFFEYFSYITIFFMLHFVQYIKILWYKDILEVSYTVTIYVRGYL